MRLIGDGDTVATGGFIGIGFAEGIAVALEELFLDEDESHFRAHGKPRNLTLVYAAGQGDGKNRGLNHFGHEGLVRRVIGGHWGLAPKLQKLAIANKIEAYNLPQGVITHLFRDIAAHRPAHLTTRRPRHLRRSAQRRRQDQRLHHGRFGRADHDQRRRKRCSTRRFPIDVGIIRGTTGDTLRQHHHGARGADAGGAGHRHGGAQFGRHRHRPGRARRRGGSLNPRQVKIPGIMVDCVVVAEKPEHHWQTFVTPYNPGLYRRNRARRMGSLPPMAMSERKIIARRAALELAANSVVNLGIGMPEGVAAVAQRRARSSI